MMCSKGWTWYGAVAVGVFGLAVISVPPALAECTGEDGGASVVTEIRDGEILILGDGRTVRLAGILAPRRTQGGSPSEARAEMEKELAALVQGKKVELRLGEEKRDRYGRLAAQVMAGSDGGRVWVQERLAGAGLVRIMSYADNRICIRELLARENEARAANLGLWKSGHFAVRAANAESLLNGLVRSYEIVEGRVQKVVEIRGRTYLNFGEDYRRDFSVYISEKSARQFGDPGGAGGNAGTEFAKLKGQFIRVRGWIENFNGPSIAVTHPEQIEVLGSTAALPR